MTTASELHQKVFDYQTATEVEFAALNRFLNQIQAEQWPDDPPRLLEETIRGFQSIPPFISLHLWAIWREKADEIVALARFETWQADHNQDLADFSIEVLPEMRRQGLAKQLLQLIAEAAQKNNRRRLITGSDSGLAGSEAFLHRLGAKMSLVESINQLDLTDLNRDLLTDWQQRAQKRAGDFELQLWEGPYPEEDMEAMIKMREVMNTAPLDDLEVEDIKWTPQQLREIEATLAERKTERWTLVVRHQETGEIGGYTDVFWRPDRPHILDQGDTGVFPKFRQRGLGRWLKAAMLEKILRDRPQANYIRTGNAASNAAMLRINHELGFKLYKSWHVWQLELDQVLTYLAGNLRH